MEKVILEHIFKWV